MDNQESQVPNRDTISFIFFKPFSEHYYSYSINTIENSHLIERTEISKFLMNYAPPSIIRQTEYFYNRFFSFLYIKELKVIQVMETEEVSDYIEDIVKNKVKEKLLESDKEEFYVTLIEKTKKLFKTISNL